MDRRNWFRRGLRDMGRHVAGAVEAVAQEAGSRMSGGQRYLRPPGAAAEAAFLLSCERHQACGSACPTGTIRFLGEKAGAAVGTPYLDPEAAPCTLCLKCIEACPSGALAPPADWRQVRIGRAELNTGTCWAYQGQICDVCYGVCPLPDVAIRMVYGRPAIDPHTCTGCGYCAYACPSTPNSITVVPA